MSVRYYIKQLRDEVYKYFFEISNQFECEWKSSFKKIGFTYSYVFDDLICRYMRKKFAESGRVKNCSIFQMLLKSKMQVALALLEILECKCKTREIFQAVDKSKNIFF
jgi:hypothetical protein